MIVLAAKPYWCAVQLIRRAPDRDNKLAFTIIRQISARPPGPVQRRAIEIMKEIDNGTIKPGRIDEV